MPVSAVKTGNVQLGYDGSFIFAEVNADKIHWCQTEENTWRKVIEKSKYGQTLTPCIKMNIKLWSDRILVMSKIGPK